MTTWPWYDRIGQLTDMLAGRTVAFSQVGDLTTLDEALSCPCEACAAVRAKLAQRPGMTFVGTLRKAPTTRAELREAMQLATSKPAGNS